jgi:O-antigen/teichoic acid export membrane protein
VSNPPINNLALDTAPPEACESGGSFAGARFVNAVDEPAPINPSTTSHGLSVRHNFAWTLAGNLTYALCQWAVIVLLAKLGNTEMVGRFALALAVAYPITFMAHMQLRVIYVTDLEDKYPAGEVLGLRLLLSVVAIAVLTIVCAVAGYNAPITKVILVVGLAQLVDCISENYFAITQRHERMDRIAKSQMLRSLLSLSAVALAVYLTHDLLWGVAGYVLARSSVLLAYDAGRATFTLGTKSGSALTYAERILPRWNFRKQFQMLWVALPLGAVSILGSLNGNMPRYFIEKSEGPRELGIYSALNYVPAAALMVATALGYAAFARLSKLYFEGDLRSFKIVLGKAVAVCAFLGIGGLLGGAVLGRQVLTLLYRPEYAEHIDLLLWLLAVGAVGCVASCLGCAMSAASQFRVQVPLFLTVTGTSFVACHFLIPRYGLRGAALAALLAMCVQLLGTALVIFRALTKRARALQPAVPVGIEAALESH